MFTNQFIISTNITYLANNVETIILKKLPKMVNSNCLNEVDCWKLFLHYMSDQSVSMITIIANGIIIQNSA